MKTISERDLIDTAAGKRPKRAKSATITRILKTAYQLHFRDKSTRQAVKRCLG